MKTCFCSSDQPYSNCCGPLINGSIKATSAEKLMRSRYSAYVVAAIDYLYDTTHNSQRTGLNKKDIENWAKANNWQRLEVLYADTFTVEFKAFYTDSKGKKQFHHEKSTFVYEGGSWYYLSGTFPS
jgi:SEC-C motif-containing protein